MNKSVFAGNQGPLLIAEIGGNHEGNFEYAKELTKLAISSKVDYVKFQLYTGDTLVSRIEGPSRNSHFKRFELKKEQHIELAETIIDAGIGYMASVWDEEMIDWIDRYLPIYKIGSGDLTAYPIIAKIAKKGKPIIISGGLATEQEIIDTVKYIQGIDKRYTNPEFLAILQCTSMYPISEKDANLSVIQRLRELTGLTIGYSDHTEGNYALEIAYALGAEILEFHFTDNRAGKEFRDHKVSLTADEVNDLINRIKRINELKGNSIKKPLDVEIENGHVESFRRAVYPRCNIKADSLLTEENLICLRPNHGIDAREYENVIGKKTIVDISEHQSILWENLK